MQIKTTPNQLMYHAVITNTVAANCGHPTLT